MIVGGALCGGLMFLPQGTEKPFDSIVTL